MTKREETRNQEREKTRLIGKIEISVSGDLEDTIVKESWRWFVQILPILPDILYGPFIVDPRSTDNKYSSLYCFYVKYRIQIIKRKSLRQW